MMVSSKAKSVAAYLNELTPEKRAVVSKVRDVILARLPNGYRESMTWGMISYEIPLEDYPETYNGKPLAYMALAAQKRYFALYLMGVYSDPEQERRLRQGFDRADKKLDMGKSCLRFRSLEDLPLDVIAEIAASMTPSELIARYESSRGSG
jgi:hypothetical protein